uniref:Uncharacterized protein n=1 Tax=Arundo donax TaxID=35708 RepID=A0A0A8YZY6_ARUDO
MTMCKLSSSLLVFSWLPLKHSQVPRH